MSSLAVRFNNGSVSECNVSTFRGRACEHAERLDRRSHRHLVRGLSTPGPSDISVAINFTSEVLQRVKVLRRVLWTSVPCLSTSRASIWDDGNSAYERLKRRQHRGVLLPLRTAVMFSSCWEGSRRCHDGEVAPWHVAGKTFPHRRKHCGTKGRWPCDQ